MFSISNEELKEKSELGDTAKCNGCGGIHEVRYGDIVKEDGSTEKSKLMAFVKCPESGDCYLVGINGKSLNLDISKITKEEDVDYNISEDDYIYLKYLIKEINKLKIKYNLKEIPY